MSASDDPASNGQANICYKVDFGSYAAFFGVWLKRSLFDKANRRRFWIYSLIIGALTAISMWSVLARGFRDLPALYFWIALPVTILVGGAFYAFIFVFILAPFLQFMWHAALYLFSVKTEQIVNLSATGIVKTSANGETTTSWPSINAIVETRKTMLLFTGRNAALIIPKSAFASPEAAGQFTAAAHRYWQDANSIF